MAAKKAAKAEKTTPVSGAQEEKLKDISGNILLKEPMSKTKNIKGFTMKYYTKEMEQQIEQFKNKE